MGMGMGMRCGRGRGCECVSTCAIERSKVCSRRCIEAASCSTCVPVHVLSSIVRRRSWPGCSRRRRCTTTSAHRCTTTSAHRVSLLVSIAACGRFALSLRRRLFRVSFWHIVSLTHRLSLESVLYPSSTNGGTWLIEAGQDCARAIAPLLSARVEGKRCGGGGSRKAPGRAFRGRAGEG